MTTELKKGGVSIGLGNWLNIITLIITLGSLLWAWYDSTSELEVVILDPVTVIDKPSDVKELKIYYDSIPITNLKTSKVRITNNSNVNVRPDNVVDPITISVSDSGRIIKHDVIERTPQNLAENISIDSSGKSMTIAFNLLNNDDKIELNVLHTSNSNLTVNARIEGIKDLNVKEASGQELRFGFGILAILLVLLSSVFEVVTQPFKVKNILLDNSLAMIDSNDNADFYLNGVPNDFNNLLPRVASHLTHLQYEQLENSITNELLNPLKLPQDIKKEVLGLMRKAVQDERNQNFSIINKARTAGFAISGIALLMMAFFNPIFVKGAESFFVYWFGPL